VETTVEMPAVPEETRVWMLVKELLALGETFSGRAEGDWLPLEDWFGESEEGEGV
jgi:hypothetical protein